MSDLLKNLAQTSLPPDGHYGAAPTGVAVTIIDGRPAAGLAAVKGQTASLIARCRAEFGIDLIDGPTASGNGSFVFVGTGPGKWLALSSNCSIALASRLRSTFGALAAVTDQSDANIVFAVEGPRVRDCMAKGPAIDFSPSAFKTGDAATTVASHIGLTLWQASDAPSFHIAVGRSFAPSFARHLLMSGAEYGVAVTRER